MEVEVGSVVTGKVTGITKFGAFVSLPGGKSGLVHISEVASAFVSDVHDYLTEGQEVQVKVLAVTPEGKINLSVKQAHSAPAPVSRTARPAARPSPVQAAAPAEPTFEDRLKRFMSQSDSIQSEVNRHMAGKRGGRRRK